jgi:alkyl hydroperoxide reductase subunit AhpC
VGISIDHIPALKAWSESIGGITYPLLSDFWPHGAVAQAYGVFNAERGMTQRAIVIVDTAGIVRYIDVHDIKEQPDEEQIFEVLATLH